MKKLLSDFSNAMLTTVVITIFILPPSVSAENILEWNTFRLPGYYNGPEAGQKGLARKILDYYIRHLPEYKHQIREMPLIRSLQKMEKVTEGGYLVPGKTKLPPEQLKNVQASTIHLVMPPPGIAIRKTDLDTYFSGGRNVSLSSLLNGKKKIIMFWISGATVHPKVRETVEDYLRKNENHPNVHLLFHQRDSVLKMLKIGRIDYGFDHALSFQYACSGQKGCLDNITFIGVNEAREDVYTYTFAAKTKTGNDVLSKINMIHNSEEYKQFLRQLILQHYPPNIADIYIQKNMELVGKEMK